MRITNVFARSQVISLAYQLLLCIERGYYYKKARLLNYLCGIKFNSNRILAKSNHP